MPQKRGYPRDHKELFSEHILNHAHSVVTLDRDALTGYTIGIDAQPGRPDTFTTADILPLLPPGAQWIQAGGWHSYIGQQFSAQGKNWLAIGLAAAVQTRKQGAYATLQGAIFRTRTEVAPLLCRLADELDPGKTLVAAGYGVLRAPSQESGRHRPWEAHVLRCAARRYERERAFHFRTVLLSEDEMQLFPSGIPTKFLVVTVPKILATFSRQARARLALAQPIGGCLPAVLCI